METNYKRLFYGLLLVFLISGVVVFLALQNQVTELAKSQSILKLTTMDSISLEGKSYFIVRKDHLHKMMEKGEKVAGVKYVNTAPQPGEKDVTVEVISGNWYYIIPMWVPPSDKKKDVQMKAILVREREVPLKDPVKKPS